MENLERRVLELRTIDPALLPRHAETIAELEGQVARWKALALTDPVTGVLSETAHMTDSEGEGLAHGVMEIPDILVVYDHCGTRSGRVFARDIADAIAPVAARHQARLYHLETPKFALIAARVELVGLALRDIKAVLDGLTRTVVFEEGVEWSAEMRAAKSLDELLRLAPRTFGATVRARARD